MISIVMPSYNREAYLAESINSVIGQSYKKWELIIVDDGSTDGSHYLYDYFTKKDDRIKVIYTKNQGISKARLTGVEAAQGDFIAVMDSDDLMHPERLKKSLKAIKGYDFVYSSYYIADEKAQIQTAVYPKGKVEKSDIVKNASWPHVTIMAKRDLFNHSYREDFNVNDDAWLVWQWFKLGHKAKMIKEPLMIVRMHEGNVTKEKAKEIAKTQKIMDVEYDK